MKRFRILPSISLSLLMMAAPALLISTVDSAAAAQKSNKPRKEASKKSDRNAHQRRGEISQRVTPESKAPQFLPKEQRGLDSDVLKSMQAQDEKSAKSF